MPTDPKPLFRVDALRPKLADFALPAAAAGARPKLGNWKSLLHSKAAEKIEKIRKRNCSATFSTTSSATSWAQIFPAVLSAAWTTICGARACSSEAGQRLQKPGMV